MYACRCIYVYLCAYLYVYNDTPLQYSCLENPMDGEAWWAAVLTVASLPAYRFLKREVRWFGIPISHEPTIHVKFEQLCGLYDSLDCEMLSALFKLVLEKAEEPEIKLPTSAGSLKKQASSRKITTFVFFDYAKAFDCVDHNKLWKILKKLGIPDHLTCLLRNLYPGQEATVKTGHRTTDWFHIGKGVCQGCKLSPCLFNFYAEYKCVR